MITRTIDLNLIPGKEIKHIHLNQRDVISAGLVFRLWNDQTRFTIPSGATGTIEGTKKDRCAFQYVTTVSAAANTVTANITYQMTCVPGPVPTELRLKNSSGQDIGTANFILEIEPAGLSDNPDISKSELKVIEQEAKARVAVIDTYITSSKNYADLANQYKTLAQSYMNQTYSQIAVATSYANDAKNYATQSSYWADRSKGYAEQSLDYANLSQGFANQSSNYANLSKEWSKMSESWAIGATGIREGEDTNNSKYWSQISRSWAEGGTTKRDGENEDNSKYWNLMSKKNYDDSEIYRGIVEKYADLITPEFDVDFDTMILYQTNYVDNAKLEFTLDEEKVLYYDLAS